jgi:hypothetical protein
LDGTAAAEALGSTHRENPMAYEQPLEESSVVHGCYG